MLMGWDGNGDTNSALNEYQHRFHKSNSGQCRNECGLIQVWFRVCIRVCRLPGRTVRLLKSLDRPYRHPGSGFCLGVAWWPAVSPSGPVTLQSGKQRFKRKKSKVNELATGLPKISAKKRHGAQQTILSVHIHLRTLACSSSMEVGGDLGGASIVTSKDWPWTIAGEWVSEWEKGWASEWVKERESANECVREWVG